MSRIGQHGLMGSASKLQLPIGDHVMPPEDKRSAKILNPAWVAFVA